MDWTNEEIKVLREEWAAGASGGEIGKLLGRSRMAIIGKARRLQLKQRPSPIKERRAAPPTSTTGTTAESRVQAKIHARPETIRSDLTCQWPFSDPDKPDFHFCGAPVILGRSYCDKHHRRAYTKRRPWYER